MSNSQRRPAQSITLKNVVLVCGSRSFNDRQLMFDALDALLQNLGDVTIIHGGAIGADVFASKYAWERRIPCREYRPNYKNGNPKAAPLARNSEMIAIATHVVAFWDGESRGTRDTINKAKAAGLPLRVKMFQANPMYKKAI